MYPLGDTTYDVAIVGSGVAGSLSAYRLAKAGLRVAVLEAGPWVTAGDVFDAYQKTEDPYHSACYPSLEYAPRPQEAHPHHYLTQKGPDIFATDYLRVVGGTTWHWGGACLRMRPDEFDIKTRYGVGRDWPLSYADIEPYYLQAEDEMGISGDQEDDLGSPRSAPFPLGPMPISILEHTVNDAAASSGMEFRILPQARGLQPYKERPACHGHSLCTPICPIGAMYNGAVHATKAIDAGAELFDRTQVTRIDVGQGRNVTSLQYRHADGHVGQVKARAFVVAANTMETTKLLLASSSEATPNGVANSSDMVGRNLMGHPSVLVHLRSKTPVFAGRGPQANSAAHLLRSGDFKSDRAGVTVVLENRIDLGGITVKALQNLSPDRPHGEVIRDNAMREFDIYFFAEQLPDSHNRITIDPEALDSSGMPVMNIHFQSGQYSVDGLDHAMDQLFAANGMADQFEILSRSWGLAGTHVTGTTVMGKNPKDSVVTADGQSHDHPNMFIAGGGVFASSSTAHPTLTIAALALKTSQSVLDYLEAT